MHNSKPILENETNKIFWDFVIQTDNLNSARQQNQLIVNKNKKQKKTCWMVDFTNLTDSG